MKVLVFGSRRWIEQTPIERRLRQLPSGTTIVHGAAAGADNIAGYVAGLLGLPVKPYPANWVLHGKAAGPIRNQFMLDDNPDLDLALGFILKGSPGSTDMLRRAKLANIPVEVLKRD